jgi:hypothetical protein
MKRVVGCGQASLADLRVLSEEREWLSSVLTKQLVREEDKANKLQKELDDLEKQHRLLRAEKAVPLYVCVSLLRVVIALNA